MICGIETNFKNLFLQLLTELGLYILFAEFGIDFDEMKC